MKKIMGLLNAHYPLSDKLQKELYNQIQMIDIKRSHRLVDASADGAITAIPRGGCGNGGGTGDVRGGGRSSDGGRGDRDGAPRRPSP